MIEMIHASGMPSGSDANDGPVSGKEAGLKQSVSAHVWLPTAQPANYGCSIQVTLSFPRP